MWCNQLRRTPAEETPRSVRSSSSPGSWVSVELGLLLSTHSKGRAQKGTRYLGHQEGWV